MFQLINRYEMAGVSLQAYQPMVWGSAALNFYNPTQVRPADLAEWYKTRNGYCGCLSRLFLTQPRDDTLIHTYREERERRAMQDPLWVLDLHALPGGGGLNTPF